MKQKTYGAERCRLVLALLLCYLITSFVFITFNPAVVYAEDSIILNMNGYKQTGSNTCGSASSMMILLYSDKSSRLAEDGIYSDRDYHQIRIGRNPDGSGAWLSELTNGLNYYFGSGTYALMSNASSLDTMISCVKNSLSKHRPIIASMVLGHPNYNGAYKAAGGSGYDNRYLGHYVVIFGLYYQNGTARLRIKDPTLSADKTVDISASDFYASMPYDGYLSKSNGGHPLIYGTTALESHNPHGYLDVADGGAGTVRVCGWAIDDDAPDQALEIHVYVGGPAGSGEPHGGFYAGNASTDVGNHRFDFTFETNKTGEQPVYAYAINVGAGENILLNNSPKTVNIVTRGSEMTSGYDRTIPDGDYIIAMASNPLFYLDIDGASVPANSGDNVSLCQANTLDGIPDFDVWTVQYRGDGFYSIKQRGTNVSLDLHGASTEESANVEVYPSNDTSAQKWAISLNGRNGYRIQAKCSGFSLDANGGLAYGANIQQYTSHDGDNQSWVFIPYMPSQPIENGRYIVINAMNQNYELDVYGDSGDIPNETNVQIWNIEALSRYNSFDFVRLSNGYYKVIHAASGKVLDLYNGNTDYVKNISLHDDDFDGNRAHEWAVMERPGGYAIVSRFSGYALDIWGDASDGTNVIQWPYHGLEYQNWIFIPAEYTVSYDANGGEGAPEDQIKYWHTSNVTLSSIVPVREGYTFKYWISDAENASEGTTIYNPGDVYAEDADLRLYAVWEQDGPRIELSAEEVTLEQYGEQYELTATLHIGNTGASELEWSVFHVGEDEWDDSLEFSAIGETAIIKPKERTGNYLVLCSTKDKEAMASCLVTVQPAAVIDILLDQTEVLMDAGDMTTLTASIVPDYTTLTDVNWSSSEPTVATVAFGDVYALAEGTTTITCESVSNPSIRATCIVTVAEEHLTLSKNECTLKQGVSTDLHANLTAFEGNSTKLVWKQDEGIELNAAGGDNGESVSLYSLNLGTYNVTCQTEDGRLSATCVVTIVPADVDSVSLRPKTLDLAINDTSTLIASVEPYYLFTDFDWTSSNRSVVAVDLNGVVRAVGPGSATITCSAKNAPEKKASCTVTVTIPVNSIKLNRSVYEFSNSSEGGLELTATLSPDNASNKSVTWFSSNTGVATVSNGIVTPVAAGYARITCESVDGPMGVCDIVVHADRIKRLPKSLKTIEAETFYGTSLREVIVPEGATSIDSKAFGNCGKLALINIPASVKIIASDAFSGSNVAFVCENTCYATEYADVKGIPYIIGSMPREVVITAEKTTVMPGQSVMLQGSVSPDDAPKAIHWSIVEGSDIATISGNGNKCVLSANATGHVTVAATAINSAKGTISISIIEHPTSFGIWFDGNGGNVDTDHKTAEFDVAIGPLPAATKDYYTFEGWYTSASGGTNVTVDTVYSDYYMGDITLYAHWTEDQLPSGTIQKESKQQYRYQDKTYSPWSDWGPRTQTRESTGELKKERQLTEHYWYYDLCQNCGRHSPYTVCWDCGYRIGANWRVTWLDTSKNEGGKFGNSDKIFTMTDEGRWFYWTDDNGNGDSRTVYQYATRTCTWSIWSVWADTPVSGSTTRNVQTRTVYRYKAK